jgi:hypothetical protein
MSWCVIFGTAGIHDSDIGHCGSIVNLAAKPLLDPAVAIARPPFGTNLGWRGNRNHQPARTVINRPWQGSAKASWLTCSFCIH